MGKRASGRRRRRLWCKARKFVKLLKSRFNSRVCMCFGGRQQRSSCLYPPPKRDLAPCSVLTSYLHPLPTRTSRSAMDIPKPVAIFLNELEGQLKQQKLMMCAAVFAWSVVLYRNYSHVLQWKWGILNLHINIASETKFEIGDTWIHSQELAAHMARNGNQQSWWWVNIRHLGQVII